MLFNSFEFVLFFIVVTSLYFAIPFRFRWILLLVASYFFYGYWEPRYLLIIVGSTLIDYYLGKQIFKTTDEGTRKIYLYLSLFSNLGVLFIFKYFNFFNTSFAHLFSSMGMSYMVSGLDLLLPVGISFYTFQTLSYTIDIYNKKIAQPEYHLGRFALFVSFYPQLVAGPIERASHLIPQFRKNFNFDLKRIESGLSLVLWGLFKKVVIADRLAPIVNEIYNHPTEFHGYSLLVATVFFAFQIYCDFSGYSDIAIGTARVMGFDIMKNFNIPYFSASISEFWKRWHISLSTWFRDYVYIPLGGNRTIKWRWYYNLFITFLISGLWHGANWTFIVWGALHGSLLLIESTFKFSKARSKTKVPFVITTFLLVLLSWIFFRANTINDAQIILFALADFRSYDLSQLSFNILSTREVDVYSIDYMLSYSMILILLTTEYFLIFKNKLKDLTYGYRLISYVMICIIILLLGAFGKNEFIYFQF